MLPRVHRGLGVGKLGGLAPVGLRCKLGGLAPVGLRCKLGGLAPVGLRCKLGGLAPVGLRCKLGGLAPVGLRCKLGGLAPSACGGISGSGPLANSASSDASTRAQARSPGCSAKCARIRSLTLPGSWSRR